MSPASPLASFQCTQRAWAVWKAAATAAGAGGGNVLTLCFFARCEVDSCPTHLAWEPCPSCRPACRALSSRWSRSAPQPCQQQQQQPPLHHQQRHSRPPVRPPAHHTAACAAPLARPPCPPPPLPHPPPPAAAAEAAAAACRACAAPPACCGRSPRSRTAALGQDQLLWLVRQGWPGRPGGAAASPCSPPPCSGRPPCGSRSWLPCRGGPPLAGASCHRRL